jgi:hypothetical protein
MLPPPIINTLPDHADRRGRQRLPGKIHREDDDIQAIVKVKASVV